MSRLAKLLCACALVAGLSGVYAGAGLADPAKASPPGQNCFWAKDWQGWKSPSPDVIYIRVRGRDIFRLDLAASASDLNWPNQHLISKFHGSDVVCSPLDLELYVSDGHGMREPLFVKSITKLTPEEAAAIPPQFRP